MRSGPRAVGDLLVSAVPALRDRLVEVELRAAWTTLVGTDAARRSRPLGLSNGCLHVVVDNSPWLHELTLRGPELATRLHAEVAAIRSLRFSLGVSAVDDDAPPAARPAPRGPRLTEDDTRAIDAAAAAITDPALAPSARRLLARAWGAAPRGTDR